MTWSIIIPIIVFGLALIFFEIFVMPGLILGIFGGLLVVFGVVQSFIVYGPAVGAITLLFTILVFVIGLLLFFKSGTWKKVILSTSIDGKMNTINTNLKQGDTGKAISRLAPMGKAYINNVYLEVATNGEYVEENSNIVVIKIDGSKIIVKKID